MMKPLRVPFNVVVLAAVAFAGCVGNSESTGLPPAVSAGPAFDDTTGSITGQVITDEILPIVGAQVGIAQLGVSVLTDEVGRFSLNFIPPGTHAVSVIALGFKAASKSVDVTAGIVTEKTDFVLTQLPSLGPYYNLRVFDLKVGGALVKVGLECMYGSQYGIFVPPGMPISNANVKTCQGTNACAPSQLGTDCRGPTEVHYGHCGNEDSNFAEYGCDFTNEWQTIVGEVMWVPPSATTGRGWSWEILAPNTTRAGNSDGDFDQGSVDQKDLHDWWKMTSQAPIQTRIDRETALLGSPSGTPGNHPMVEEDLCGSHPTSEGAVPGGCDWVWRLFPGWCTVNGATGQPYGCEKQGPDFALDPLGTPVQVYFTYFIRSAAPEGWSALPDT